MNAIQLHAFRAKRRIEKQDFGSRVPPRHFHASKLTCFCDVINQDGRDGAEDMSDGLKKSRGARKASLNYAGKGRSKKGMAERRSWGNQS